MVSARKSKITATSLVLLGFQAFLTFVITCMHHWFGCIFLWVSPAFFASLRFSLTLPHDVTLNDLVAVVFFFMFNQDFDRESIIIVFYQSSRCNTHLRNVG